MIPFNSIEWEWDTVYIFIRLCRGGTATNVTQSAHYSITFSLMSWYHSYIIVIAFDNDLELNDKRTTFVLFCGFDLLIIKIHFRVHTFLEIFELFLIFFLIFSSPIKPSHIISSPINSKIHGNRNHRDWIRNKKLVINYLFKDIFRFRIN